MSTKKLIVIGCDDTAILSAILSSMRETTFFSHNTITATRFPDVEGLVKSQSPDLVLLCFRNNQQALADLNPVITNPAIPVLCLTKRLESETLHWNKTSIVFTYPLEHIKQGGFLNTRINSIFLLRTGSTTITVSNSLAEAARLNQPDNTRNLSRYVMELDQKIDILSKIKDRIAGLYPQVSDPTRAELMSIVNSIKMSANNNKLWDDFKLYFEETNPGFLLSLAQKYPDLTPIDLKYCCYLKMNMSNDDIRNLLGINQKSVRTHKYRLKKKMSLHKDQDLRNYLRAVDWRETA